MKFYTLLAVVVMSAAGMALAQPAQTVKLNLVSSGAKRMFQSISVIHELKLDDEQPASVKTLPAGLSAPWFTKLQLGPTQSPTTFHVLLDKPAGKPPRLFVDANHNGDLMDDPAAEWEERQNTVNTQSGERDITSYYGGATLQVPYGAETLALHVLLDYHPDKDDPTPGHNEDSLTYYQDFARAAKLTLGQKSYRALLTDPTGKGDYRDTAMPPGVRLVFDLNEDGRFDFQTEGFSISAPFNVGGTTSQISAMAASGGSFRIAKATQTVEETKPWSPPNRLPYMAPEFQAVTEAGKEMRFPQDYRGKLVLLHFWSAESEPCLAELANLAAAYEQFHDRSFDVLGVNLDSWPGERLAKFTQEHKLPWPQVCDAGRWKGEIAARYYVRSLPALLLVDGDKGTIVGYAENLRGGNLAKAVEFELTRRKEQ